MPRPRSVIASSFFKELFPTSAGASPSGMAGAAREPRLLVPRHSWLIFRAPIGNRPCWWQ
eukprot:4040197-Pyramimonas_sp.AAC.1